MTPKWATATLGARFGDGSDAMDNSGTEASGGNLGDPSEQAAFYCVPISPVPRLICASNRRSSSRICAKWRCSRS